ncbi:MTA/SAH nucleosidase [Achromobacter spanius]|uniref:5'-methylthioadenosine/adenosylhomocysteine nucleosidase n=1 Tax=Achromobacter spanius TaxID=217203 RepID=UPI000C2CC24B|nr:5'-methylthioadenosine/adenosylhomocysteine nucleosidase [Achromobacter spanius]AUA56397.1 5'-methylthioadenosine/adenosylhomocysteine nucleosidase [Achromobacter spanius]CAB3693445.1 Aminodeoxyfutalosine nucleosidase [Achromobacter spanius]SPT37745.1 MTA/SAH nucleosidase [Achromobacter denitrificans]VEE56032.1 MTA/SAH nucleosidase [Achromobacter spanius]
MKRLAILGALHEEIADLLAAMEPGATVHRIAMRDFHVGTLWGTPCVIALSRIGKVAASATASIVIREFDVSRVVFTGLAGGLHADVEVGDVVVASTLMQHDMDARPLFDQHEIPLLGRVCFDTDAGLSKLLRDSAETFTQAFTHASPGAATQAMPTVHHGLIATGDRFVSHNDEAQVLRKRLPTALCVEMEGAAMAQVCYEFGVPFAVLRVISDRADHAAKTDFTAFLENVARVYSAGILSPLLKSGALLDG